MPIMASPPIDLTGKKFGRLTAFRRSNVVASNGSKKWFARCECGSEKLYEISNLKKQRSCGCLPNIESVENLGTRLLEYSMPEPNSGCWLWLAGLTHYNDTGSSYGAYGKLSVAGKGWKAHRASYTHFIGPIPKGIEVCHSCDNPYCINPEHLFLGTHKENMKDRDNKQRRRRPIGSLNPFAKLNEQNVRDIRPAAGTNTAIAERYGLDQTTISQIKLRKSWKHVD